MNTSALESAGKEELKDELLKIKARQKKIQDDSKQKASQTLNAVATIGSSVGLSYFMGLKKAEVVEAHKADWDTADDTKRKEWLQEKQGVMGLDYDMVLGVACLGLGITDSAGEWSAPLAAIGTGALASFASRAAYENASQPKAEETPAP